MDGFLFAQGIARPANRAFFVVTPEGVNTCISASGHVCRSSFFCGYHNYSTGGHGDTIYSVIPFAADPF